MRADATSRGALALSWACQLVAAAILGQTLFFKFSAASESVHVFATLGVEPWGRLLAGTLELVAVVLLLVPRWAGLGAVLAVGLMLGALGAHLTVLGIAVQGDGGLLFALALITLACAATVAIIRRRTLPIVGPRLARA
jgi:hypothetical protein